MKRIKWLLWILLCFVVVFIGGFLYLENNEQATLSLKFLNLQTPEFSLYTWLLIGFSCGAVIVWIFHIMSQLRIKMKLKTLEKQIQLKDDELQKLRVSSLKD